MGLVVVLAAFFREAHPTAASFRDLGPPTFIWQDGRRVPGIARRRTPPEWRLTGAELWNSFELRPHRKDAQVSMGDSRIPAPRVRERAAARARFEDRAHADAQVRSARLSIPCMKLPVKEVDCRNFHGQLFVSRPVAFDQNGGWAKKIRPCTT